MKKTTHVIQLVRELVPGNGVSNVCSELSLELAKRGISNEYITIKDFGIHNGSLLEKNKYKKRLKLIRDVIVFATCASLKAWKLKKKIEKSNASHSCLVLCHNDALYGDAYIAHGLHSRYTKDNPKIILKNPFHLYMAFADYFRYSLGLHSLYLFWNTTDADYCKTNNKLRKDTIIIPQGIPSQRSASNVCKNSLSREYIIENAQLSITSKSPIQWVFSFCGHEFERKGLQIIIDAMSMLNQTEIIACLAVAGEGSPSSVVHSANVPIYFCGKIANAQQLFREADALVIASSFETGPLVVLESLAVGTPVLSTAVGFCNDIIKNGHNGYIIERTTESIYTAMRLLIESKDTRIAMRENSIASVSNLTWGSVTTAILSGKH